MKVSGHVLEKMLPDFHLFFPLPTGAEPVSTTLMDSSFSEAAGSNQIEVELPVSLDYLPVYIHLY